MGCSIDKKVELVKQLITEYIDIRAPLNGKNKLSEKDYSAMVDYVALMTKNQKQMEELSKAKVGMLSELEGKTYRVKDLQSNVTGGTGKTKGISEAYNVRSTVFNVMEYKLSGEATSDYTYIIEGEVKDRVLTVIDNIKNIIVNSVPGVDLEVDVSTGSLLVNNNKLNSAAFEKLIETNPALGILVKQVPIYVKGKPLEFELNMGAVVALTVGTYDTLADTAGTLIGFKDEEQVAEIAGVTPLEVTPYLQSRFGMGALGLSQFADSVGGNILNHLGMKVNAKTTSVAFDKRMKASFGLISAKVLESRKDLIEPMSVNLNDAVDAVASGKAFEGINLDNVKQIVNRREPANNSMVSDFMNNKPITSKHTAIVNTFGSIENAELFRRNLLNYIDINAKGLLFEDVYKPPSTDREYRATHKFIIMKKGVLDKVNNEAALFEEFIDVSPKSVPVTKKPKARKSLTKRRDKLSSTSKKQLDYINLAESTPYTYNTGMSTLMTILDSSKDKVDTLRKALGYPFEKDDKDLSFMMKQGNESRRNRIDKVIEDNLAFYESLEGKDFYFKYFLPSNNRFMIDSATVNPQNDKELARWLVNTVSGDRKVSTEGIQNILDNLYMTSGEFSKLDGNLIALVIGAVQAFDGDMINGVDVSDVEKNTLKDVLTSFKAIMESKPDDIESKVLSGKGHIGQKATVLHVINEFRSNSEDITTDVVYEVDGLTNALFYKILQMPLEGNNTIKEKVGVISTKEVSRVEGVLEKSVAHMGDIRAAAENYTDNYQGLGGLYGKMLADLIAESSDPRIKTIQKLISSELFVVNDLLDTTVKALRDFAKPGTMIVNYGAGIRKIVIQAVEDYINGSMGKGGLLDKFLEKTDGEYSVSMELMKELLATNSDKDVEDFREKVRTTDVTKLRKTKEYLALVETVQAGIGEEIFNSRGIPENVGPLSEALQEMYGPYIEAGNALLDIHNKMFEVFDSKFKAAINIATATPEDVQKVVSTLRKYIPSVPRPDTVVVDNNTIVIGKQVSSIDKEAANAQELFVGASLVSKDKAGSINATANGIEGLTASLLVDNYTAPGAKLLPFTTHTQDSFDAMQTTLDVYESTKTFILQIFDALLIDGQSIDASSVHNKGAMLSNLRYNSYEESIMRLELVLEDIRDVLGDKDTKTFEKTLKNIAGMYNQVTTERSKIFGTNQSIMQMSGLVKSRYDYNTEEVKTSEKQRQDKAKAELATFVKSKEFKDSPEEVQALVTKMVKGVTTQTLTSQIFDISWNGLEEGKLADILQVIKETDTALRTISGVTVNSAVTNAPITGTPAKSKYQEFMDSNPKDVKTVYVNNVYRKVLKAAETNKQLNDILSGDWKADVDAFISAALNNLEMGGYLDNIKIQGRTVKDKFFDALQQMERTGKKPPAKSKTEEEQVVPEKQKPKENTSKPAKEGKEHDIFPGVKATKGQNRAINSIKNWVQDSNRKSNTYLLAGRGGTGKTAVIAKILEEVGLTVDTVVFVTPTNSATDVLKKSNTATQFTNKDKYGTVASIIGKKPRTDNRNRPVLDEFGNKIFDIDIDAATSIGMEASNADIIIVDEASMIQIEDFQAIKEAYGDKLIIFMGDVAQLPPIENKPEYKGTKESKVFLEHMNEDVNYNELDEVKRQDKDSTISAINDIVYSTTRELIDLRRGGKEIVLSTVNDFTGIYKVEGNIVRLSTSNLEEALKDAVSNHNGSDTYIMDSTSPLFAERAAASAVQLGNTSKILMYNQSRNLRNILATKPLRKQYLESINGSLYPNENIEGIKVNDLLVIGNLEYPFVEGKEGLSINNGVISAKKRGTKDDGVSIPIVKNTTAVVKSVSEPMKMQILVTKKGGASSWVATPVKHQVVTMLLDDGREVKFPYPITANPEEMATADLATPDTSFAYVNNVHKAQGVTLDTVYLDYSNIKEGMSRDPESFMKGLYVAVSRPRKNLILGMKGVNIMSKGATEVVNNIKC